MNGGADLQMKREVPGTIVSIVLFSLAFVGPSFAQAVDPYSTDPPPKVDPTSPGTPQPSETPGPGPGSEGGNGSIDGGLNYGADDVLGNDLARDLPAERGTKVPDGPGLTLPFAGSGV